MTSMNLGLLGRLALGKCQICGSFFETGEIFDEKRNKPYSYLSKENLQKALKEEKGIIFWNREISDRKHNLKIRETPDGSSYERRYICPDCVYYLLSQFSKGK